MKRIVVFLLSITCLYACQKVSVNIKDVIFGLTLLPDTLRADGTSTVAVSVQLPTTADVTKRTIKFTASNGSWKGGTDSTISVKAIFIDNQLIAKATLIAGTSAKDIKVSAQPDQADVSNNNFVVTGIIKVSASEPVSIKLTPSSFGINSNYQGEVTLTGLLKNSSGNPVSKGAAVVFTDYLADGSPANGLYRKSILSSDDSSTVSTIYSVGAYPIGTVIFIKAAVVDATGNPSPIQDIVKLTINK